MICFKVLLEYDGTRYSGWQEQKNARTVMGEIRKAARQVFGSDVEMQGAGRTDAGVHALGQAMHIKVPAQVKQSPAVIKQRLNDLLPADIVVLDLQFAHRNFHARHDARSRVYVYQISRRKQAFMKRYVWWVKEDLNIERMQRAASLLAGRHDFVCFRAADAARPDESTIVQVEHVSIETEEDVITIRIEASHFLWRMVRRIIGVLVKVGKGEISLEEFQRLIDGEGDPKLDVAAWTAPASGLFLEQVRY
ncbi:MAG: tRNA pseudouridine(38-40) synthase TruA [Acidobacteria bacterium]|nr:MAG: tRNA pseudouridine(38-40) synthase TruA [Acidobacteriota bacterium]